MRQVVVSRRGRVIVAAASLVLSGGVIGPAQGNDAVRTVRIHSFEPVGEYLIEYDGFAAQAEAPSGVPSTAAASCRFQNHAEVGPSVNNMDTYCWFRDAFGVDEPIGGGGVDDGQFSTQTGAKPVNGAVSFCMLVTIDVPGEPTLVGPEICAPI